MWYVLKSEESSAQDRHLLPTPLVPKAGTASSQPDFACELCLQASMLFIAALHSEANYACVFESLQHPGATGTAEVRVGRLHTLTFCKLQASLVLHHCAMCSIAEVSCHT